MSVQNRVVAFWLMPAREAKDFFEAQIRDLAERYDAPVFEPHVTLHAGNIDERSALGALQAFRAEGNAIELQCAGIQWSANYTTTLFLQFHPSAEASAMSDAVCEKVGGRSGYELKPHLSLLYKEMPNEEKAKAAGRIELPFSSVVFDAIKIISTPAVIRCAADVRAWQTLGECRIGKNPS